MRTSTVVTGLAGAAGALVLGMAGPAAATPATFLGGCSVTDISPNAGACFGYYGGNVNGGSAQDLADAGAALAALGLAGPYVQVEHLDIASGGIIAFSHILGGVTYVSIHWGAGNGPVKTQGGTTGFYRLDLAPDANLDQITSNWGSLSNAVLWSTNPCVGRDCDENPGGDVPEPATWAMMILGFGGTGALMRRRRKRETFA